jgi:hypothetical protein
MMGTYLFELDELKKNAEITLDKKIAAAKKLLVGKKCIFSTNRKFGRREKAVCLDIVKTKKDQGVNIIADNHTQYGMKIETITENSISGKIYEGSDIIRTVTLVDRSGK